MTSLPLPQYFIKFDHATEHCSLPDKFTFPFFYQPHSLAQLASKQLQQYLTKELPNYEKLKGRMYGVLVVRTPNGELGFLSAVSGTITNLKSNKDQIDILVPGVFEGFDDHSYFHQEQARINQINGRIEQLSSSSDYIWQQTLLASELAASTFQITSLQKKIVGSRQKRKLLRIEMAEFLTEEAKKILPQEFARATENSIQLSRESVQEKKYLAELKRYWLQRVSKAQSAFDSLDQEINTLKSKRRKSSNKLQKQLFKQYQFLNIKGETKDLTEVFSGEANNKPPAGSGDCAAPKLLQYAFANNLTPVCMAEFWWGQSATSEIRKHALFYPSCQGKCQPILSHMLDGMAVDDNPLLVTPKTKSALEIIYQDEHLVVVNKPSDLLSVPGKHIEDSVYSRIKAMFPKASGGLVLHRLDMATSGLLVLSLNERAHKHLQQQFINKEIDKRYFAVVDGKLNKTSGEIRLPLITDIYDRPRQKVCYHVGKPAHTKWQVIGEKNGKTKLALMPVTGRTHQLRVHCAHPNGLNTPIVGDTLYGTQANRLHLHAQHLSFIHPISKKPLTFEVAPDF